MRLTGAIGSTRTIHGISAGFDGQILYLFHTDIDTTLTFDHDDSSAQEDTAASQVITFTAADVSCGSSSGSTGCFAMLIYDGTQSRWMLLWTAG